VRVQNCLSTAKVVWIGDLAQLSEAQLMAMRSFGLKSLTEIKQVLGELGLSLNMQLPDWKEPFAAHQTNQSSRNGDGRYGRIAVKGSHS